MAVSDMPRARAFYETILAVKLVAIPNPEWEMFMFPCDDPQGVSGALVRMPNCRPGVGGTTVYLNVEGQLDAVLARIPAAGGKVVVPRTDISPHGFIGLLEDSEGNVVGLHSRV
jgi:predicted enzyme related to lactoylglutathione lyase